MHLLRAVLRVVCTCACAHRGLTRGSRRPLGPSGTRRHRECVKQGPWNTNNALRCTPRSVPQESERCTEQGGLAWGYTAALARSGGSCPPKGCRLLVLARHLPTALLWSEHQTYLRPTKPHDRQSSCLGEQSVA